MWYKVDFKRIVVLFLPVAIRTTDIIALIQSLIAPLVDLYDQWVGYRAANLYRLAHNGQVCHLRKVLNDTFDSSDRRIQILDGNKFNREYIYTPPEKDPKYLGTLYLRPSSDYADTGVDFIVLVPNGLQFNIDDMKAMVNYYRLAAKRYDIRYE